MEKWYMIVNPRSASAATGDTWVESQKALTDGGLEVEAVTTAHAGHAIELARDAAARGIRKFIAVGGDGTIHEVMTGLLRFCDAEKVDMGEFTLGVLPYGTGNDWIRSAGIPKDMAAAAGCILKGKTAKEDVVRMTFENGVFCMANIGGIGLDADICYHTNTLKNKGRKGEFLYTMVAPYSIFTKDRQPVEIEMDGEKVYSGKLYTVVIGNGIYRGGGLKQTEEGGNWSDGLLEASILPGFNRIKGMKVMMHALSNDLAAQPEMITRRFRELTVKPLGKPDRVEADGEIPGTTPVTVELTGQQINIIVA